MRRNFERLFVQEHHFRSLELNINLIMLYIFKHIIRNYIINRANNLIENTSFECSCPKPGQV
uniref:Uncharacterized protein n=1 Tax=Romanomermis culicivorax TaxID=13658 RepID=A0A915IK71_ROMCU